MPQPGAICWDEVMTDVLILGGTGWLSGRVAAKWLERTASVTCLARGGRSAPKGATLVVADRADADAYDALAGRDWDEVVEISSIPEHVAAAVEALRTKAENVRVLGSYPPDAPGIPG